MELSSTQILFIKKELLKKGLTNSSLREDVLDHFCCIIEDEMDRIPDFKTAYLLALKKMGSLRELQAKTTESIESAKLSSKFMKLMEYLATLAYLLLGLCFLIMPVYLTFKYSSFSFILAFSPFEIMGFYLCVRRIDYKKLQIIPFQKSIFPDSLVH